MLDTVENEDASEEDRKKVQEFLKNLFKDTDQDMNQIIKKE